MFTRTSEFFFSSSIIEKQLIIYENIRKLEERSLEYSNRLDRVNNFQLFRRPNLNEICPTAEKENESFVSFQVFGRFVTFFTAFSRSNAMSGILASSISENKFAKTFACLTKK